MDIILKNCDCIELLRDMPDKSIDCVVTDPPYGISFRSNARKEKYDHLTNDDKLGWLVKVMREVKRVMKDDAHAYIFFGVQKEVEFQSRVSQIFPIKNKLIWDKGGGGMGDLESDYALSYEQILFISNGERKLNGKRSSNILKYSRSGNIHHPTEKPIDLLGFLILKSTSQEDTVFDPFMGSGSTAIACIRTKRNFIGAELDPKHFETAERRVDKEQNQLVLPL